MLLSTNAFNWAALRSGMGIGEFIASLRPEREAELFKAYNAWRRSKGLPEEVAPAPVAASAPTVTATPAAPERRKKSAPVDDLSALINEVAAEVEEKEAEEATLIQNALDGADEIVEEETSPVPAEVEEEIEAEEPIPADDVEAEADKPTTPAETIEVEAEEPETMYTAEPEVATTPSVAAEPVAAASEVPVAAEPAVDFSAVIRSLPKEPDPVLYSRIKYQYGEETKSMAQAALKEATKKHRGTAAIRAFLGWLNGV